MFHPTIVTSSPVVICGSDFLMAMSRFWKPQQFLIPDPNVIGYTEPLNISGKFQRVGEIISTGVLSVGKIWADVREVI